MSTRLLACLAGASAICASTAIAGPVDLDTPTSLLTISLTVPPNPPTTVTRSPALPPSFTATDTIDIGVNTNQTTYNFFDTSVGGVSILDIAPIHVGILPVGTSISSTGILNFTIADNPAYALTGSGTWMLSPGSVGMLSVVLTDTTSSAVLFSQNSTFNSPSGNYNIDSSGAFLPGTYRLDYTFSTVVGSIGLNSLTGNLNLAVTPEPSTLGLLGLGIVGYAFRRRRAAAAASV